MQYRTLALAISFALSLAAAPAVAQEAPGGWQEMPAGPAEAPVTAPAETMPGMAGDDAGGSGEGWTQAPGTGAASTPMAGPSADGFAAMPPEMPRADGFYEEGQDGPVPAPAPGAGNGCEGASCRL